MLIEYIDTQSKSTQSSKLSISEHWTKQTTASSTPKQYTSFKKIINLFKRSKPEEKVEIPPTTPPSVPVEAIDNLKERLARVMSDRQNEITQELIAAQPIKLPVPNGVPKIRPTTKDKGSSKASSDKRVEVALSQIQNNLSHMLQNGMENHVSKNTLSALVTTLENLQPMQKNIVQYLRLKNDKNEEELMTKIEYQIYVNVVRVTFNINYAIKNSTMISPRKLEKSVELEDTYSVLEQYEKFFELDPICCKLL
jgi:hypothetical protein